MTGLLLPLYLLAYKCNTAKFCFKFPKVILWFDRILAPDSACMRRMTGLTRDGTAEPNSRDQVNKHRENPVFLVQLATSRIGNRTHNMPSLLKVVTTYTYKCSLNSFETQYDFYTSNPV